MHRFLTAALLGALVLAAPPAIRAQEAPASIQVDARIALASLESLCDSHLANILDGLEALSATRKARSADWTEIEGPLRRFQSVLELPAVVWFSTASGTYWTVDGGRQSATIADRPYFARLVRGQNVVGDLVVSRSTGKPVAVVAVPVLDANRKLLGVLGASVRLDALSALIKREMDVGSGEIFFSVDGSGVVGIAANSAFILRDVKGISPEVHLAFAKILTTDSGTVTYLLHGEQRAVIYRKSPFTGWRYAFGVVGR